MIVDAVASSASFITGIHRAAHVPQPLLRDRHTIRVPIRAIGAGIEAASIGARTATSIRRMDAPGLDVDITACYPSANLLAGVQDFLTHEVTAHHITSARRLAGMEAMVTDVLY